MQPLVVTLDVDPDVQARWDAERSRLFPPGRTRVGAHVTLFHAVPGELTDQVHADLRAAAATAPFDVQVSAVLPLGRGAAYRLESAELQRRHAELQRAWQPHLTAQDRQRLVPHVTVQNKVDPARAAATVAALRAGFAPYAVRAEGFTLWRYDGGPWTELQRFRLRAADPPASR